MILSLIDQLFKTWHEALNVADSYKQIVDISSNLSPAKWVETTTRACVHKQLDGMVTAPLSKVEIHKAGYKDIGHTEMLKRISKSSHLFMAFLGTQFNVLLATAHVPISKVPKLLTAEVLESSLRAANELKKLLPKAKTHKPLALCGLNPHAGEQGIIGAEEGDIFKPVLAKLRKARFGIEGPVVPDALFMDHNRKQYSIIVTPYHDQGLIPFKMLHGQESGVHITMGLPFVRTSVDHGTAKDIFGKNKANPNSMVEAIQWAVKLCRLSREKGNSVLLFKSTSRG